MTKTKDDLLLPGDFQRIFGVSRRTARRWIYTGTTHQRVSLARLVTIGDLTSIAEAWRGWRIVQGRLYDPLGSANPRMDTRSTSARCNTSTTSDGALNANSRTIEPKSANRASQQSCHGPRRHQTVASRTDDAHSRPQLRSHLRLQCQAGLPGPCEGNPARHKTGAANHEERNQSRFGDSEEQAV